MSKKHSAVFDDVLSGLGEDAGPPEGRGGARFLARQARVGERMSGALEEKTLRWIDPAQARMWARHNRAYDLLTEDNCRDLIDGIRAQGRQEFPAIVRETGDADAPYEVICGARRHFAVSWLRANNFPQFRYLVEVRDLSDEEAFRLSDIENRDRADLSDLERARDYAQALGLYYDGRQKDMAARLEVSDAWLSRFLQLAKLPDEIVAAFPSLHDVRELHARTLGPHLRKPASADALIAEAEAIRAERAREGRGPDAAGVMARLKAVVADPKAAPKGKVYRRAREESGVTHRRKGRAHVLEFSDGMGRAALEAAFRLYLEDRFGK
ncbi:ParB/RepB/Spo0J family partition protein [Jannaschia sp. Os4]|uniref:ParB/RepB/Spo0J family partition protein n=1 Tax=Jannaschia sp. Os4 TaxID=2807617 RepID=UPI00193A277F|nr:ParB/RepB/Spo0J family partition protein [Jannaschia sp. Os4]MBM2578084.1 ParB/RepB/Spo0J family partition protein [Jannaschia sp. Os4]